jgi:hypothetical protein
MPIIINEFEIVPPPVGAANNGGQQNAGPEAAELAEAAVSALQPVDIEDILRRAQRRRLRLWAD